jgi:hypothetical protein
MSVKRNDMADSLAKMALHDISQYNYVRIRLNCDHSWEFVLYWNRKLINKCLRDFYKELNQGYYKASRLILNINRHHRLIR